jgi:hypothetical protein
LSAAQVNLRDAKLSKNHRRRVAPRVDSRQLTIDWICAAAPPVLKAEVIEPEKPAATSAAAIAEKPAEPAEILDDTASPLLQVLPWDFSKTFPPVLQDALDAGVVEEEDAEPEGLTALHAEHAREMLAALSELDRVQDTRRAAVNPAVDRSVTGNAPHTQVTKEKPTEKLCREVDRLEHWWQTLLDTYETVFGPQAADAFDKYVRARHARIEVMAMPEPLACVVPDLPLPKPLPASVRSGGLDEDGPVDPGEEEVHEITESHVQIVTELVAAFRRPGPSPIAKDPSVRPIIEKHAAEFGREATAALLEYCRRRAMLNDAVPIHSPHRIGPDPALP